MYEEVGLFKLINGGIQIDINSVLTKRGEASLCNHNCTTEFGGYTCPAAFTKVKGVKPNYASAENIIKWVSYGIEGIKEVSNTLLNSSLLQAHAKRFKWPSKLLDEYRDSVLLSKLTEVNIFGGNPEMHPEVGFIIGELKSMGCVVNLTTTGRRFLKGNFLDTLPDYLALSIDDLNVDELEALIQLNPEDLKDVWKKVNPLHGQKQKAIEALYTLKTQNIPTIINMPLHKYNLDDIYNLYLILIELFPNALLNPYPVQSRFMYEQGDINFTKRFETFVDWVIDKHFENSQIVKRLHYWLAIKAIYETDLTDQERADFLAGDAWHCEKTFPGYLQIGRSTEGLKPLLGPGEKEIPGGRLGCFWNTKANDVHPIESSKEVSRWMMERKYYDHQGTIGDCTGCLMPRLVGDVLSLEQGLNPALIEKYLEINKDILELTK